MFLLFIMFVTFLSLLSSDGLEAFRRFLQTEFSDENIEFWLACEDYKKLKSSKLSSRARKIYDDYVTIQAPREASWLYAFILFKSVQILLFKSLAPCSQCDLAEESTS